MSHRSREHSFKQLSRAVAAVNKSAELSRKFSARAAEPGQRIPFPSILHTKHWTHSEVILLVTHCSGALKLQKLQTVTTSLGLQLATGDAPKGSGYEDENDAGWSKKALDAYKKVSDAVTNYIQSNASGSSTPPPAETGKDDKNSSSTSAGATPPGDSGGVVVHAEFLGDIAADVSPAIDQTTDNSARMYLKDFSPGSEYRLGEVLFNPAPNSASADNRGTQKQNFDALSGLGETAGAVVDSTILFLESAKKAGLDGHGAPARLGTLSTAISVVNAYEDSDSSGEFVYLVGKDAVVGYASTVVGSATAAAVKGSVFGPWGATVAGVAAGTATTFALNNGEEAVRATLGEVGQTFSYKAMHYEIWNLYMGSGR